MNSKRSSILVPVDFTEVSLNAFRYATQLAYKMDLNLVLLHVFSGSINTNEPLVIRAGKSRVDVLTDRLKLYTRWYPNEGERLQEVNTQHQVLEGSPVKKILEYADEHHVEMIVAGTRDKHSQIDRWLGTVSLGICQKARCPVLVVPKNHVYRGINQVVIASDYHTNDPSLIEKYLRFNRVFAASTSFVHIETNVQDQYPYHESQIHEIVEAYGAPNQDYEMVSIKGTDVIAELVNYVKRAKADLLLLVSGERSGLEGLLHRSMTAKAVYENNIPTMVIHSTL